MTDFLWYSGESQIDGTSGHWQFYDDKKPNENHEIVRIDWQYVAEDDRTLTFTNNNQDSEDFEDTLTYSGEDDDAGVDFYDASKQDSTRISWNRNTGEGFIIAPNYNSGEKACWDSKQEDVDCPN